MIRNFLGKNSKNKAIRGDKFISQEDYARQAKGNGVSADIERELKGKGQPIK